MTEQTYLKLYRKGYDNLRLSDADQEEATARSVMHVTRNGITTDIHVVFVDAYASADCEYYGLDGEIKQFSLTDGDEIELDDFIMRAERIGYDDICMGFHAPRDIVFKRADAKEWNGEQHNLNRPKQRTVTDVA